MCSHLRLELFGSPSVNLDGKRLTGFITVKSRALLFYLAMKPGVHGRRSLATLLWPESPESSASKNLRNIVSNLGQLVGEHLEITRETIGFRRDADYYLDVEHFSALIERYRRTHENIGDLEEAVALYKGDFLDGFHVSDTSAYEIWQSSEEEQLRQAQLTALYSLAAWHFEQATSSVAMEYVSRLLTMDNLSETGYQLKMALLAAKGRRSEAMALYDSFCRLLDEELGVEPSPETMALHSLIKSGEFEPSEWRRPIQQATFDVPLPKLGEQRSITAGEVSRRQVGQLVDLADAPREVRFFGRHDELRQLRQWLVNDQCRFIALTGIGGMGKSTLAGKLARGLIKPIQTHLHPSRSEEHQPDFEVILWRTLINAPPLHEILKDWLTILSGQQLTSLPESTHEQLQLLLRFLKSSRCLLIVDNFESVLEESAYAGAYRRGFEGYEQLVRYVADSDHQSCLLMTSRELPRNLLRLEQDADHVHIMRMAGLADEMGKELLRDRGLTITDAKLNELVRHYSGNPLALKLVADTAQTVFAGNVDLLLREMTVFGDIRDVLDDQVKRLTPVEMQLLIWLAVEREPVTAETLWHDLAFQTNRRQCMDALRSLYFRALLELVMMPDRPGAEVVAHYTLQNVVMEYITNRFVETIGQEIESGAVDFLRQFALVKSNTREYVQDTQHRLLLEPVAQGLTRTYGIAGAIMKLRSLLERVRNDFGLSSGYAAANILHLLIALEEDLDGYDFSGTTVRQADLRSVALPNVSFRGSDLSETIFRDTFGLVSTLAFSPGGEYIAARSSSGTIAVWRLEEYQPYLTIESVVGSGPSLAFSPDGQCLAGGDKNGTIKMWDVSSGKELLTFAGHSAYVIALTYSPDGQVLCSSGEDTALRMWDTNSGRLIQQFDTPGNIVLALAFSPDGQTLVAGGYDGALYQFDMTSNKLTARIDKAHSSKIRSVAFTPYGRTLATAGEDNAIHLWNFTDGSKLGSLCGHTNFVTAVTFHPGGDMLASSSADGTIRLWNWHGQQLLRVMQHDGKWVTCIAFNPDGSLIASGGYDRKINLWESRSGHLLHTLQGTSTHVNEVVYSPDGRLLASCSFDQPIRIWDANNGQLVRTLEDHNFSIRRLCFSPDSSRLVASGDGRWVWLWNVQTGKLCQRWDVEASIVRTMVFGMEGHLLAVGAGHEFGTLTVWDSETGQLRFSRQNVHVGSKSSLTISPDGMLLAYSDFDASLVLVNSTGNVVFHVPHAHRATVSLLRFSPDGRLLASQDREGDLKIWQVGVHEKVDQVMYLKGFGANVDYWSLEFSPDSRLVAFKRDGQHVGVADVFTKTLRFTLEQTLDNEDILRFARDNSVLITANESGHIQFWDMQTGKCARSITGHAGVVLTLATNPVNNALASSGYDGIIRIWDIEAERCELSLNQPGPYEGMDITNAMGLSPAQVVNLQLLGAVVS